MRCQQTIDSQQRLCLQALGVLAVVLLGVCPAPVPAQTLDYPLQYAAASQYSDAAIHVDQSQYEVSLSEGAPTQYAPQPLGPPTLAAEPVENFGIAVNQVSQSLDFDALITPRSEHAESTKFACGVDESSTGLNATWANSRLIPWEKFSYGEYIGPARTPHVPTYRLRVDDQIEFVFQITRSHVGQGYRFSPGDVIRITSPVDERLNESTRETGITIMPDGSISLDLIGTVMVAGRTAQDIKAELDMRYARYYETEPQINLTGVTIGTRLRDFLDSVDARAGSGGQARQVNVTPDGTIRLPLIGTVGVVGLSLDELEREINMRYAQQIQGLRVTPILTQRAPRFIYVAGEVAAPGRFELSGPTSAMQAIALAGGWNVGGNLRQIVVFRRDQNWRLMALKLDLAGGLFGKRPTPSDEIWLRDSDIILVPKSPILRLADAVELYFSRTLYGIFPSELGVFDAQSIGGN